MRTRVILTIVLVAAPAAADGRRTHRPDPSMPRATMTEEHRPRRVRSVVRRYMPRIQHCYQLALQRDWNREGTLLAEWLITTDGAVVGARVAGSAEHAELAACVTEVLATMQFGGGDAVLVHYPFTFTVGARTRRARAEAAIVPEPLPEH